MADSKAATISSLLQPKTRPTGKLVEEVGAELQTHEIPVVDSTVQQSEPTMMELMMAAQAEAASQKQHITVENAKSREQPSLKGFKKGFLDGGGKKSTKPSADAAIKQSNSITNQKSGNTNAKITKNDVATISGANSAQPKQSVLVMDEVQRAMQEDSHPLLQQIKKNEWVTPDLMAQFQSSEILAAGFRDARCMAAMELMQQDPEKAKKTFAGDATVTRFLQEFGRVMAAHFEGVARQKEQEQIANQLGPLHKQAIERANAQQNDTCNSTKAVSAKAEQNPGSGDLKELVIPGSQVSSSASTSRAKIVEIDSTKPAQKGEEERVQEIIADPELRALLMDPTTQSMLMECGDPEKFQRHMRDPAKARAIRKLFDAGLVGTAR